MFSVLDRYIGRTILSTIMATLFMLVSLSGIIKFVDQLRKTGKGDYDVWGAGLYTLLSVPKDIEIFFPMAALLGALLGLGALATRSELVVMEASGFTRLQIASAVMKTAIPLVLLTMAIGEWVAPIGEQTARNVRAQMLYGSSLLSTKDGMWAKDNHDFIYIQNVVNESELSGVSIYHFDEARKLQSVRYAGTAVYNKDRQSWTLSQVDQSDLSQTNKIVGTQTLNEEWKTNLTPDKLGVVAMNPESLSASGLYEYSQYLKQSGQEANRYSLLFWKKIFTPISVAVMMLMALSFIFGPLRSVPMGVRVVTGIACGFVFYVLNEVFGQFSNIYNVPSMLGALLPSAVFLTLSLFLLRRRS
ncbi:Lipopolysaccharide export system permease protein lptG [Leminorella richardii]|uniref:Lipopolysaccharide export system permease protein lptG n=1 Tax=Leminorella richardii TaxID=158841 RepID=A0A2X4XJ11_9GAMM|nr:LPS export ABC transporter permease LptG [Leminorella richardii]SQI36604.1 Lipopolysaccharide export system permease protein lptG [Leminorella richardii]